MDLLVCDAVITRWIFQDYKACPGDALPSRSFWKMCFAFLSWVHSAPNLYKQFQCAWPQKVEPSVHSAVAFDPLMSALPLRRRGASCQLCTCEVNRFRNADWFSWQVEWRNLGLRSSSSFPPPPHLLLGTVIFNGAREKVEILHPSPHLLPWICGGHLGWCVSGMDPFLFAGLYGLACVWCGDHPLNFSRL